MAVPSPGGEGQDEGGPNNKSQLSSEEELLVTHALTPAPVGERVDEVRVRGLSQRFERSQYQTLNFRSDV